MKTGETPVTEFLRGRMTSALAILNGHLEGRAFAIGERPTIADISMCGYLYWPDEFGVSWADYPHIGAWLERIKAPARLGPSLRADAGPSLAGKRLSAQRGDAHARGARPRDHRRP